METEVNREQVIRGLECLAQTREPMANPCKGCHYIDRPYFALCVRYVAIDALKLMKRKGYWDDDHCSECGFYVYHGDMRNYCPCCGAKMEEGEQK